jgi:hypothetical protein
LHTDADSGWWSKTLCKEDVDDLEARLRRVGLCREKSKVLRDQAAAEYFSLDLAFGEDRCSIKMPRDAWNASAWAQQVQSVLLGFKAEQCGAACPGPIQKNAKRKRAPAQRADDD